MVTTKAIKPNEEAAMALLLACRGVGDKLSAHSRSVPWALVREFYCHLQRVQPQAKILDITHWKDWETKHLRSIGVQILDPRQGTLLDLGQALPCQPCGDD